MKRPLAFTSVVFVMVLLLLQIWDMSLLRPSPVNSTTDGSKELFGYLQDDRITICGTISDYSTNNQYEQITTELILKEIQILPRNEDYSEEKSSYKQVTKRGQSIIVYLDGEQNVMIGSDVVLSGKLYFFPKATNPGEFDAEKYYANRDVLFAVKKGKIQKFSTGENRILQSLKEFRLKQEEMLATYLPAGNAAIMKAMLFGNKKEMEEEIKTLYQNSGIAHVLAISGLHISLIGMSIYRLLQRLPVPRWVILLGSEIFLVLYGCMVGLSSSAFRAIFMFTFFLLSMITKRSYDMLTAMAASAILQLLIHPGYIFDCGFQLSYAAILGIGIILPTLENINDSIKEKRLKKALAPFLPSLSVTLMTAPILIYHYYELSFFSIVLNFIVLPLMSPLLLCGIGMLVTANILGSVSMIPTKVMAIPINLILWIYETSCRLLEWLPVGRKNIAPMSLGGMVLYYGLLLILTILVRKKKHMYQFLLIGVCISLLSIPKRLEFSAWMLDVGQGDCNVIFTEEGCTFIIDCGSSSKYNVGKKILIPFLKYHGIGTVDGVIITHPDADHMNGVMELLELGGEENITVSNIYIYEKALENEPESWEKLMNLANKQNIPVNGIAQGDVLQTESLYMECLYPLNHLETLTGNSSSLVLKVESGSFQGLFTGDLEADGERKLLNAYSQGENSLEEKKQNGENNSDLFKKESCDLLKVGHHGSSGSSSGEFLQWVNPKSAVISCGKDNSYGHPHQETLKRLEAANIPYLITYEEGAICYKEEK